MRRIVSFLLLLLLIAAVLRVDFFFTVVYFFLAVVVLARLWLRRGSEQLQVERRFAPRAFAGDRLDVELCVRNRGWLPVPWLELYESVPPNIQSTPFQRRVLSLGPREEQPVRYVVHCRRRGYYTLGPATVHTGDLLGIARRDLTRAAAEQLIVYPRVVPLDRLGLPTHSPLVALPARAPLFEDPTRIVGVRDYRRGDSPRRMHWPATARTGRLVVKRYQPAIARETLICLDLDREAYGAHRWHDATELAIVVAASLANHVIVREGLPAGLLTAARDPLAGGANEPTRFLLPPRAERAHLISILEVLARVEATPRDGRDDREVGDFADVLRRARAGLAWGTTLAVITGRETAELRSALLALERAGFVVALILVQPPVPVAGVPPSGPGVPVHRVWRDEDLGRLG